ncbi:MAG: hypothetical protein ACLP1Y_02600 [Candidatus Acidiferrales bacterium]
MTVESKRQLKVADEVWIATALLHRDNPRTEDFTVEEIARRAEREAFVGGLRSSFRVHVAQHCVANRPPHPARHRMLFETSAGRRRLYRKGDSHHPARKKGKITPDLLEMPYGYDYLLAWYRDWSAAPLKPTLHSDTLLALQRSGKRPQPRKPRRKKMLKQTKAGNQHRS